MLAECASIARFEKEWEEQKILQATDLAPVAHNFSLRGKQLRTEDIPMVCDHIALCVGKGKGGERGNGSGDERRSLLRSRSLAEKAPRYKSMIESQSYGGGSFKWLQHVQTLDLGRNLLDEGPYAPRSRTPSLSLSFSYKFPPSCTPSRISLR